MAQPDPSYFDPANHPAPGTGPGPPGVPGGTDRSYSVEIMVCACVTTAIGFTFVGMRFYTRMFILRVMNWEDWLILIALVSPLLIIQITIEQTVLVRMAADVHGCRFSRPPCVADSSMVRPRSY